MGFSTAPLKLALGTGMFLAVASVIYGLAAILMKLAGLQLVPGYASLLVAITFLSGIQLIVVGAVGMYVGRIYDEVRGRPLYVVRESQGLGEQGPGEQGPVLWQPADTRAGNGQRSSAH
jgi:dolichol-phosphate mannosyltransferase